MTDKNDTRGDVRIKLSVTDWQKVPSRTYTTTVEIDAEDWLYAETSYRHEMIQEEMKSFIETTFELDWEILSEHDISEPVEES